MDLCKQSVRAIAQGTRWNSSLSKREGNWTPFLERRGKVFYDNDTMKLSVNEAKLTGLGARNCATITKVLILKFSFGPEMFPGFSRNRSLGPS